MLTITQLQGKKRELINEILSYINDSKSSVFNKNFASLADLTNGDITMLAKMQYRYYKEKRFIKNLIS